MTRKSNPIIKPSGPAENAHKVGYARVSTLDQNHQLQIDALLRAGVARCDIFEETVSGAAKKRPILEALMKDLRRGEILIVWKLDRLGRNLANLLDLVDEIDAKGAYLKFLDNSGLDTTTAAGRVVFQIIGAVAEFERNLTRERTIAGLAAARERGRVGGRAMQFTDNQILSAMHDSHGNLTKAAQSLRYEYKGDMRHMSVQGFKKALARAEGNIMNEIGWKDEVSNVIE